MKTRNLFFAMVKADFFERTRRTSFLITVCMVIYLGYAVNTGQIFIKLEQYRGIYNSAWVGSLMSLVITFFLGISGFYLVKNAIERDERTGVGQIIATTPLSRAEYLIGKWLSNFAVLTALVGILALGAFVMQLFYSEDAQIQVWALVAPFLFVALPMMALVAAFAVFFETVSWLKGGFGNMVYFFVVMALFTAGIFLTDLPWLDVSGISLVGASMKVAAREAFPTYGNGFTLSMASDAAAQTFVWTGIDWSVGLIFQRVMWLVASLGIILLGALFFNRFDPNRGTSRKQKEASAEIPLLAEIALPAESALPIEVTPTLEGAVSFGSDGRVTSLTALTARRRFHTNLFRLVWLECLMLVKGLKWYWLAGMACLWIGCIFAGNTAARQMAFILSGVWPILIWSKMGERDARWQTEQLIIQAAYPLLRGLTSAWLAGVTLTALACSGVLIGRLVSGEPLELLPWSLSVLFIPTLALTMGTWSRSSKLFEVIYAILWYLGPFNKENGLAVLDYLGIHAQAPVNAAPLVFSGVIGALLALAVLGRQKQMIL